MAESISDCTHVVHLSTNVGQRCEHCAEWMGAVADNHQLAESINHHISAHGYQLLHVGAEPSHDDKGNPWQSTVAVLGK